MRSVVKRPDTQVCIYANLCILCVKNSFDSTDVGSADMSVLSVAVAGATGYAGGEALRILAGHPGFEVTCVTGHSPVGARR